MRRYKPVVHEFEIPYVPEAFLPVVADAANTGDLFGTSAPVPVVVTKSTPDCLCVRVVDEKDVHTLRFDTLEIWTINDHTIQLRVAYRGWLRARIREIIDVGFWHVVVVFFGAALLLLAILLPESIACWGSAPSSEGDRSLKQARPAVRAIAKRLKEIAVVLPA